MTPFDVTYGYRQGRTAVKRFNSTHDMVRFIEDHDIMHFSIKSDCVLVYRINKEQRNEIRIADTQQEDA